MAIVAGGASAEAQRLHKRVSAEAQCQKKLVETVDTVAVKDSIWRESYADSLSRARMRIDSMKMDAEDSRFSKLFTPLTFYRSPANHFLRLNPNAGARTVAPSGVRRPASSAKIMVSPSKVESSRCTALPFFNWFPQPIMEKDRHSIIPAAIICRNLVCFIF